MYPPPHMQTGDTLHYINKRYNLNSNWLQLWNANGLEEIEPHPLRCVCTCSFICDGKLRTLTFENM